MEFSKPRKFVAVRETSNANPAGIKWKGSVTRLMMSAAVAPTKYCDIFCIGVAGADTPESATDQANFMGLPPDPTEPAALNLRSSHKPTTGVDTERTTDGEVGY